MGVETDILLGLGITSCILAYYGLTFLEREDIWTNLLGQIFFMVSMIFLLFIVNTTFLIIQNNSSISYMSDTIGSLMIEVFYYFMLVGIVLYILYMFWSIGVMAVNAIIGNNRKKSSGDGS